MAFRIDLPPRREMQDIEVSRRLYKEDNALLMTGGRPDQGRHERAAVTFVFVAFVRKLEIQLAQAQTRDILRCDEHRRTKAAYRPANAGGTEVDDRIPAR